MSIRLAFVLMAFCQFAGAQVAIDLPGMGSKSGAAAKSGNTVSNEKGVIDPDARVEGVMIINDSVSIDGVRIARGVTEYVSKKTGKVYSIRWESDGPSVREKR